MNNQFQVQMENALSLCPKELIVLIFTNLSSKDLCQIACSCKYLNKISSYNEVWKVLFEKEFGQQALNEDDWKTQYKLRYCYCWIVSDDLELSKDKREVCSTKSGWIHVGCAYLDVTWKKGKHLIVVTIIKKDKIWCSFGLGFKDWLDGKDVRMGYLLFSRGSLFNRATGKSVSIDDSGEKIPTFNSGDVLSCIYDLDTSPAKAKWFCNEQEINLVLTVERDMYPVISLQQATIKLCKIMEVPTMELPDSIISFIQEHKKKISSKSLG